eukprot:882486-Ditylum_brightwellii.AAC.1
MSTTISPQPTTKPDSPPPAQKGPSYADSLLSTATTHSSGGITVGGFTRQFSLRVIVIVMLTKRYTSHLLVRTSLDMPWTPLVLRSRTAQVKAMQ